MQYFILIVTLYQYIFCLLFRFLESLSQRRRQEAEKVAPKATAEIPVPSQKPTNGTSPVAADKCTNGPSSSSDMTEHEAKQHSNLTQENIPQPPTDSQSSGLLSKFMKKKDTKNVMPKNDSETIRKLGFFWFVICISDYFLI